MRERARAVSSERVSRFSPPLPRFVAAIDSPPSTHAHSATQWGRGWGEGVFPHCPRAPSPDPLPPIVADYVYDNSMSLAGNDSGERGQPARNLLTGSGTRVRDSSISGHALGFADQGSVPPSSGGTLFGAGLSVSGFVSWVAQAALGSGCRQSAHVLLDQLLAHSSVIPISCSASARNRCCSSSFCACAAIQAAPWA